MERLLDCLACLTFSQSQGNHHLLTENGRSTLCEEISLSREIFLSLFLSLSLSHEGGASIVVVTESGMWHCRVVDGWTDGVRERGVVFGGFNT